MEGKILIADDEHYFRFSVALALKRRGYEVREARDGQVALEHILQARRDGAPFDLLITDLQMSPSGGLELLDSLESLGSPIPVLVLSGYFDEKNLDELVRRKRLDCIEKPLSLEELVGRVDQILGARSRRQAAAAGGATQRREE